MGAGEGGRDVMNAEDVGAGEDGGGVGGEGCVPSCLAGGGRVAWSKVVFRGEEAFAGEADKERSTELVERCEMREQWIVFRSLFAEAEAGVEDDGFGIEAGGSGGGEAGGELVADEGGDLPRHEGRLRGPLPGGAAGVHENEAGGGAGGGERGRHGGIPQEAGDVVDDVGSEREGAGGGFGMVGVDGEKGGGPGAAEALEDGQEARLFLGGGERGGVGTGGLRSEIEEVGPFLKQAEAVVVGERGRGVGAAVGEGVRGEIEDGHEPGALAEREGAGGESPGEAGAGGHTGILSCFRASGLSSA